MRYTTVLLSATLCLLASCAGTKNFTIRTLPEGATVNLNGQTLEGTTPMTISIDQDKDLGIVVRKPGYQSTAETVRTKTSTWLSIIWTSHDPRAQYIEEDEITIPMKPLDTVSSFKPTKLPTYNNPYAPASGSAPALRDMPGDF